jgi:hypothetical protein
LGEVQKKRTMAGKRAIMSDSETKIWAPAYPPYRELYPENFYPTPDIGRNLSELLYLIGF